MEKLKHELEKLSKAYKDTPEKEEKVLIPFIKRLLEPPMKERRKLLPTIRELQWITGKLQAGQGMLSGCRAVCVLQQTGNGLGLSYKLPSVLQTAFPLHALLADRVYK